MRNAPYVGTDPQVWLQKFNFSTSIKVRYCETDILGHVNNVSYFIYFEQGRVEYLDRLGLRDELFNDRTITVVADLECQYLSQIYIQDPLKLHVRVAKIGRSSFDLEYAIVQADTGVLKATGRGAMVHIDKAQGSSTPIPEAVREKFAGLEGQGLAR
ncbi:acyl-CoA thioesterase [Cohnella nanjingensis]|uniref:Acyl-CoA thioesterase n=1 Tax=Cohnella nanjingensis TaxID=1387779 RepID=A0A7X0RU42_9BACL|nr:thioesterase family protein [Cohnella nanjingensis]MBB6673625.1 acyl-CoA thioesterase [Cohnella nanjingensis]